jgi:site-specific recombinase
LLSEAVATIHWAVLAGLEGYFGLLAALGTDGGVHLSRGAAVAAAAAGTAVIAFAAARLTACWTALGLVSVALFGVIGLIVGAEGERLTAVLAGETPILVAHR